MRYQFSDHKPLLSSIYLGGGTPSLLSPKSVSQLAALLEETFDLGALKEFTCEVNPESLSGDLADALKNAGVNRVSLGVQSFQSSILRRLERLATFPKIERTLDLVGRQFENLSVDLMFGIPDQNLENLKADLNLLQSFNIKHLSIYMLTIPEDHKWRKSNFISKRLGDENVLGEMYQLICSEMGGRGFHHYEVSNFALPGFESKHNSRYWNPDLSYFGFGPGAHFYDAQQKTRGEMIRKPMEWLQHPDGIEWTENLNSTQQDLEKIYLQLRTRQFMQSGDFDANKIQDLEQYHLIETQGESFRMREEAWILIDTVCQKLIT